MVTLQKLTFTETVQGAGVWSLHDLTLSQLNLLVGRNATGKSRCINVIAGLAKYISGKNAGLGESHFEAEFDGTETAIQYSFHRKGSQVTKESLRYNGQQRLTRTESGDGTIWLSPINTNISFRVEENVSAVSRKRDAVQHPFLEDLHEWAKSVRLLQFGTHMGRTKLFPITTDDDQEAAADDDPVEVARVFRRGKLRFQDTFTKEVLTGMEAVGYNIESVDLGSPVSLHIQNSLPHPLVNLIVKEAELDGVTDFNAMSQGMYRALALVVHLAYLKCRALPCTLLIDDIGEGLDFARSCALIEYVSKQARPGLQVVMTTNDRFVMNAIPLENWIVLRRDKSKVEAFNYDKARDKFEEFRLTGLNNFDLLTTDFLFQ